MLLIPCLIDAQQILGIGTRYDDSFREWIITTDEEDISGELEIRWAFRNDWTEWDVRIGDVSATIERKWKDDPNLWEIRADGEVVNARTTWTGEFNRWKLNDGNSQINWGTKYFNIRDEWTADGEGNDAFRMFTYWEGDPREWVIEDDMPEISTAMKIAMIFLAVHFSTPKI